MLPTFEIVARRRPVDLVAPTSVLVDVTDPGDGSWETPHPAPYAAVVAELDDADTAAAALAQLAAPPFAATSISGDTSTPAYSAARSTGGSGLQACMEAGSSASSRSMPSSGAPSRAPAGWGMNWGHTSCVANGRAHRSMYGS